MTLNPLFISLLLICVIAIIGVIANSVRRSRIWAGHTETLARIHEIPSQLRRSATRDDGDVVLRGNHQSWPVEVRFSQSTFKPELHLKMGAPVRFAMDLVPRASKPARSTSPIPTGDPYLDSTFILLSKNASDVKMLLFSGAASELKLLCKSPNVFVHAGEHNIELGIPIAPQDLGAEVMKHLDTMAHLALLISNLPGSSPIKIDRYKPRRTSWITRVAIAMGAIVTIALVIMLSQSEGNSAGRHPAKFTLADGSQIDAEDAAPIKYLKNWRSASEDDFDPEFVKALRAQGKTASFPLRLQATASPEENEKAYVFKGVDNTKRLVVLVNGQRVYDVQFEKLAGVARVRSSSLDNATWANSKDTWLSTNGDGLLLVLDAQDPASGTILVNTGQGLRPMPLIDYRTISLQ
jgi:hypothetical protein